MTPAVLLCLTGVLVDDAALHRRAAHEAANEAGLSVTADDYRIMRGWRRQVPLEMAGWARSGAEYVAAATAATNGTKPP